VIHWTGGRHTELACIATEAPSTRSIDLTQWTSCGNGWGYPDLEIASALDRARRGDGAKSAAWFRAPRCRRTGGPRTASLRNSPSTCARSPSMPLCQRALMVGGRVFHLLNRTRSYLRTIAASCDMISGLRLPEDLDVECRHRDGRRCRSGLRDRSIGRPMNNSVRRAVTAARRERRPWRNRGRTATCDRGDEHNDDVR
jgi:hypothetical protein